MQTKSIRDILVLCILFFGLWFTTGCGPVTPIPTSTPTASPSLIPTIIPTCISTVESNITPNPLDSFGALAPIPNTIYLVDYEGQPGLFLSRNHPEVSSSSEGTLILEQGQKSASFLDFKAPRKLLTFTTDRVEGISPFIKGSDSQVIYLSVGMIKSDHSEYELVYKIDLDTLKATVIWKKGLAYSPSNDAKGNVLINQVKEPYIELSILPCSGCSPCPPYGVLILNMETGAKKFLGTAGNVEIDLSQNLVSYQMLTIDYACDVVGICPCATKETGLFLTEPLPLIPTTTLAPLSSPTIILGTTNTWISPKDDMTMVYIPAGEFSMGNSNGFPNERPVHTVYLDSYWIDQTEVTNEMFG